MVAQNKTYYYVPGEMFENSVSNSLAEYDINNAINYIHDANILNFKACSS